MATLAATRRRRRPAVTAGRDTTPSLWDGTTRAPGSSQAPEAAALTLDDRLSELWLGLGAAAPVPCPVCRAEMTPRWSAGAGVVGGGCSGCGTTLE